MNFRLRKGTNKRHRLTCIAAYAWYRGIMVEIWRHMNVNALAGGHKTVPAPTYLLTDRSTYELQIRER